MGRPPSQPRTWSDAQLTEAVKVSSNWRGVMRELGQNATSAGAIRIIRRDAVRLGLDTSHFRGKRRWSDGQLRRAVSESRSWDEVLDALGLVINGGGMRTHVRSHAIRLGLDFSRLDSDVPAMSEPLARSSRTSSTCGRLVLPSRLHGSRYAGVTFCSLLSPPCMTLWWRCRKD